MRPQSCSNQSMLQKNYILTHFNANIGGRYHALAELDEETPVDAEWNCFSSAVIETVTKHLGQKKGKQKPWISAQTRDLIKTNKQTNKQPKQDLQKSIIS